MRTRPFKPIERSTVVDAVTEQLRTQILSGSFPPGARLPAERDLAEQLGINRLTLRAALSRLEALGLIETQHGTGSVVRNYREHGGVEMLPSLLAVCRNGDPETYLALTRDVLELRKTLSCEAVALAAERRTEADLSAMRAAAQAQKARVNDPLAFAKGDIEFARAVVCAAKNLGLELLLNTIARFPEEDPVLGRAMYPRPRAQYKQYATLIDLIEARDSALARQVMRPALDAIDKVILEKIARERQLPRKSTGMEKKA
jgi:GntR family transcriptional regulator, transcriptional repressor for pyruvate dehydrogenase complex